MRFFRRGNAQDPDMKNVQETLSEVSARVQKRAKDLLEGVSRGCVAGGFCAEHHLSIVSFQGCSCEAVYVMPFGVGFFASIDFRDDSIVLNHGWGTHCIHSNPLPLSGPLSHDITCTGGSALN